MRPRVVPVGDDFGTSGNGGRQSAGRTVCVASHSCKGGILNWVVAVPFSLDGGLASGRIVGDEAFVGCASDIVGEHSAVGRGGRNESESCCEGGSRHLHIERVEV